MEKQNEFFRNQIQQQAVQIEAVTRQDPKNWPGVSVDFRTDLRGVDLRSANLSGAYLVRVDLNYADLSGADLSHAELGEALR